MFSCCDFFVPLFLLRPLLRARGSCVPAAACRLPAGRRCPPGNTFAPRRLRGAGLRRGAVLHTMQMLVPPTLLKHRIYCPNQSNQNSSHYQNFRKPEFKLYRLSTEDGIEVLMTERNRIPNKEAMTISDLIQK